MTTTQYDEISRPKATLNPDGAATATTYYLDGHPLTSTDENGTVCVYTHDALGRLRQKDFTRAAREAGDNAEKFLELFDKYVKKPVRDNPDLLRKSGWK